MSERFGTHHQYHPRGPNGLTTTTYSAHNRSRPNSRSASNTPISTSCQPSSPGPSRPVQTADEAKTPFSGERSSRRAFLNSCMLYLCLVPEQFTCDEEKIFWTLVFFKDGRAAKWSENLFHQEADTGIFPI